jgi:hypothetical protein
MATVSRRSRNRDVTFQRRHYEFLVDMFHEVYRDMPHLLERMAIAQAWARELRRTNHQFNREKFVDACVEGFK